MEGVVGATVDALMLSSIYILVSLGFALVLSINGILNFAHGALYMIGGYVCYWLSTQCGLNQWFSLLLTAIILGTVGLFIERFCFRPFNGDVNRTIIMAIALILILETTMNVLAGGVTRSISPFVPGILKAWAISVSLERVATLVIGGVLLLILTLFIGKTKAGQQMLAVSQDAEGAILQGIRIHRVSALAVAMSCALAAVAGSFMGAIFDLKPFMGGPMLVKAIQVVVLSGIGSIGGILAGGLIIGTIDAVLPLFAGGAVTQAVGLGIIIVLLLLKPQGLFGREVVYVMADGGSIAVKTTDGGGWAGAFMLVGLVAILAIIPLIVKSPYLLHIFILVFVYVIATSSLRTIAISGQMSLGHAGFMGIGAYTSAILSKALGWTPWLSMPLGALAAMAVAILVGYPFSRLRTIYFSMVSLFFGIGILAVNTIFSGLTGGYYGLAGIPPLFIGSKVPYYFFFLGLTVISLLILHRFESCRVGTSLKAVAQDHAVAASVGIDESAYRVLALAAGCFIVGLAGAGYAHYNLVLSHSTFDLSASINLMVYMVVGGIGSFAGPVIGAVVLVIVPELFRGLKMFTPYVFAVVVILVIFLIPQGLSGLYEKAGFRARKLGGGGKDNSAS